jgi:hypothetical protein
LEPVFSRWREEGLVWLPERGMGFYPVTQSPYDEAYFEKYRQYADTPLGQRLTDERIALVDRWARDAAVVDIGIGSGQFIEERNDREQVTFGFDINPAAVDWLQAHGLWLDPYAEPVEVMTFWDSLEHIPNPHALLCNATRAVFVSMPVFQDARHILASKHFRTDEHCWYWTREGFIAWMKEHGFDCLEHCTVESLAGREDVHSFAFVRIT